MHGEIIRTSKIPIKLKYKYKLFNKLLPIGLKNNYIINYSKLEFLMAEFSTISISLSLASLGIYLIFFLSNDDDDQDGGYLIKNTQKIQ